jgi:hypothetical protein
VPPILPPDNGFLFLDRDRFHASFAADLPPEEAEFLADSQVSRAATSRSRGEDIGGAPCWQLGAVRLRPHARSLFVRS